jgi:hypothetical protein
VRRVARHSVRSPLGPLPALPTAHLVDGHPPGDPGARSSSRSMALSSRAVSRLQLVGLGRPLPQLRIA